MRAPALLSLLEEDAEGPKSRILPSAGTPGMTGERSFRMAVSQRTAWWLPVGRGRGRDGVGGCGQQVQTVPCGMGKQQGPAAQHGELYSVSWDKP